MRLALAIALLAGCQSTLRSGHVTPDSGHEPLPDGSNPLDPDAFVPQDANPNACTNGRQIYLNFGGATLTRGAADATNGVAPWVGLNSGQNTATVPAFQGGDANSAATVRDQIIAALAPYPKLHVTTTKPTTGPFVEIVFGGTQGNIGVTQFDFAIQTQDCADTAKSDLGIVLDDSTQLGGLGVSANLALGAIGFGLGMVGTGTTGNCMCGWATNCNLGAGACTFSTIAGNTNQCPGHTNPQDQVAVLNTFCQ